MKAYLWRYVGDYVSDNYHGGGGVLIITNGDPVEVWRAHAALEFGSSNLTDRYVAALDGEEPDLVFSVYANTPPCVEVFPDAGCC